MQKLYLNKYHGHGVNAMSAQGHIAASLHNNILKTV